MLNCKKLKYIAGCIICLGVISVYCYVNCIPLFWTYKDSCNTSSRTILYEEDIPKKGIIGEKISSLGQDECLRIQTNLGVRSYSGDNIVVQEDNVTYLEMCKGKRKIEGNITGVELGSKPFNVYVLHLNKDCEILSTNKPL